MKTRVIKMALLAGLLFPAARTAASDASLAAEGNREYAAGKYDKALELYDRAVKEASPENLPALQFNRANALYRLGKLEEAEAAYKKAAEGSAALGRDSAHNLGNTLWREAQALKQANPQEALRRLRQGEAFFRQALEQRPGDADSAYNLDLTRRAIRDLQKQLPPPQQQPQKPQDNKDQKDQQQDKRDSQSGQGKQDKQNPSQPQPPQADKQDADKGGQGQRQKNQPPQNAGGQKKSPPDKPDGGQQPGDRQPQKPPSSGADNSGSGQNQPREPLSAKPRAENEGKPDGDPQPMNADAAGGADDRNGKEENAKPEKRQESGEKRDAGRNNNPQDARTAEEFIQREKADREQRRKARREFQKVERDW